MSGRNRPAAGDSNSPPRPGSWEARGLENPGPRNSRAVQKPFRAGEMVCENGDGQTRLLVGMVRKPVAPTYTERIPRELATNETWMLHRRKARPRVRPDAYFRPPGYEPEFRGSDLDMGCRGWQQLRDEPPQSYREEAPTIPLHHHKEQDPCSASAN